MLVLDLLLHTTRLSECFICINISTTGFHIHGNGKQNLPNSNLFRIHLFEVFSRSQRSTEFRVLCWGATLSLPNELCCCCRWTWILCEHWASSIFEMEEAYYIITNIQTGFYAKLNWIFILLLLKCFDCYCYGWNARKNTRRQQLPHLWQWWRLHKIH